MLAIISVLLSFPKVITADIQAPNQLFKVNDKNIVFLKVENLILCVTFWLMGTS